MYKYGTTIVTTPPITYINKTNTTIYTMGTNTTIYYD